MFLETSYRGSGSGESHSGFRADCRASEEVGVGAFVGALKFTSFALTLCMTIFGKVGLKSQLGIQDTAGGAELPLTSTVPLTSTCRRI